MSDYEYYDTEYCIPEEDFLENNRQCKLTIRSSYKLLEIGTQESDDGEETYFVIRLTKNAVDRDGEPAITYVDLCKEYFDCIVEQERPIRYYLRRNQSRAIYQNEDIHVWVKSGETPMVCIRGYDGTRINMIERTFERLMNRVDWVQYEYDRFTGDLDDDSYSEEYDDDYYDDDDYSDDSEYTSEDDY